MLIKKPPIYYWQRHRRHAVNGRMAWYAESADQEFWYEHWRARLNAGYYAAAKKLNIRSSELGRVLLQELNPNGLHLEAGCGAGYWVAVLRQYGFKVEGIEYARDLVRLVNEVYPELAVRYGDALAIDCEDSCYDSYLSFGVVEHRLEGPEPFLAEAYRVLKPYGKIIISVPFFGVVRQCKAKLGFYEAERPALPFFQYGFSRDGFVGLIQQAGFTIQSVQTLSPDRLLTEELPIYRWLRSQRGGRFVKMAATRTLQGRDGHMLLVVGEKH